MQSQGIKIGSHVSMSGGLLAAAQEAVSYGANTFMIYTGAPQNTIRTDLSKLKIDEGRQYMSEHGLQIRDIAVHAPYIINLASYKDSTYELATSFLAKEIDRSIKIGAGLLVLHPGSYTDKDAVYGIERIANGLNTVLNEDMDIKICLETMAGKGTEIGRSFEELAAVTEKVVLKDKIGYCFDTCHTHDSGYDIVNDFDSVIHHFDSLLGLENLHIYHLNGSLNKRGAKKDRHANLGAGADNPKGTDNIGFDAIYNIAHHPLNKEKIFILETPWLDSKTNLYKQEIEMLRK